MGKFITNKFIYQITTQMKTLLTIALVLAIANSSFIDTVLIELDIEPEKKDCSAIKNEKIRKWCEYCEENPKAEKCNKKAPELSTDDENDDKKDCSKLKDPKM